MLINLNKFVLVDFEVGDSRGASADKMMVWSSFGSVRDFRGWKSICWMQLVVNSESKVLSGVPSFAEAPHRGRVPLAVLSSTSVDQITRQLLWYAFCQVSDRNRTRELQYSAVVAGKKSLR